MHEDFKPGSYLEGSHSYINRFEVTEAVVEEVEAGEVDVLHFVEVDHTLLHFLVPAQPRLLLLAQLLEHLLALDRIILPVHSHKVPVKGYCLRRK